MICWCRRNGRTSRWTGSRTSGGLCRSGAVTSICRNTKAIFSFFGTSRSGRTRFRSPAIRLCQLVSFTAKESTVDGRCSWHGCSGHGRTGSDCWIGSSGSSFQYVTRTHCLIRRHGTWTHRGLACRSGKWTHCLIRRSGRWTHRRICHHDDRRTHRWLFQRSASIGWNAEACLTRWATISGWTAHRQIQTIRLSIQRVDAAYLRCRSWRV
jgi:hypothetical protein